MRQGIESLYIISLVKLVPAIRIITYYGGACLGSDT